VGRSQYGHNIRRRLLLMLAIDCGQRERLRERDDAEDFVAAAEPADRRRGALDTGRTQHSPGRTPRPNRDERTGTRGTTATNTAGTRARRGDQGRTGQAGWA